MTGHSLLSLGLAAVSLLAAVLLWFALGSPALPLPHMPKASAQASAASDHGSGGLGLAGPRNLQGAISASNQRAADALNGAK
jgi:hypothetical protein